MKTTGVYTQHVFEIPFSKYEETIEIVPFGDIHRNAVLCHTESFLRFVDKQKEKCSKKNHPYYIGMGDYDDLSSTSERLILDNPNLHDQSKRTFNDFYRKQTKNLAEELSFMKGKTIGILNGNHYSNLLSGITTDHYLAMLLGTKFLGVSSFIRLILKDKNKKGYKVDMWVHHGKSSSSKGASLKQVEDMMLVAHADIYLMAHNHQLQGDITARLKLSDGTPPTLQNQKVLLGRTGSFLRAYVDGNESYIADRAGKPAVIGHMVIELTPRIQRKTINGKRWEHRFVDIGVRL
jgi:hypothetical protein